MFSPTYRELMAKHYDVSIGMYSYGEMLRPGVIQPGTRVGRYCSVGRGVRMHRQNHPIDRLSQHPFFFDPSFGVVDERTVPSNDSNPLTIGNDVWIGDNVLILPGCAFIGDSAVVAAGSVVTHDVEPFAVVGGVPAKHLRYRLENRHILRVLEDPWWTLSFEDLLSRREELVLELGEDR